MAEKKEKKNSKSSYYKVEADSVKRTRKNCPKCGAGIFMAEHKDRHSCGTCSYTEIKK
ncbi:MAG: 30S ribosomal protein S27ae [Candidatus Diapherotrites archaeon CG08_land_8_20_14_0_20_34_12]|nr:MAG: 30S ribosomal protein S27ae [Candidatus Diapherotrites archaeon CG08_land_8_20_14_0_20_34_12]